MPEKPKVFVITLNWNGKKLLDDCISSLLDMEYPNFEVIMVDNGSTDGSVEFVRHKYPQVYIIETGSNLGYSGGFNIGLDYAFNKKEAEYVLVINNDVKVDKKVISELVKVAEENEKIGFVTGKVYYFDSPDVLQTVGKKEDPVRWSGGHIGNREFDSGQYDQVKELFFADDIFTLVNGKMYKVTGGYDTSFFLQSEEYDWQARAKALGFKIMYTPHAKIWHKESMTLGKTSPLKAYYDARNPMIVILKHKTPKFFKKYFWQHLNKGVVKNSIKVIIKDFEIKKAYKIWTGFLSGIAWGIKNKKLTLRHFI